MPRLEARVAQNRKKATTLPIMAFGDGVEIPLQFERIVDCGPAGDAGPHVFLEFLAFMPVQLSENIAGKKRPNPAIGALGIGSDPPPRLRLREPALAEQPFKSIWQARLPPVRS